MALANIDLETDDDCELGRHITITGNQFGAHTWGVVDSVGFGADPQVGDVTVTDNTETVAAPGCFAPIRILSPVVPDGQPRVYRTGYTFSGNRLLGTRNGFEFRGLRDVDVSSNDVALPPTTGCGKRAGVLLVDSHGVGITSNTFAGANNVFKTDMLSTGITAASNSTVDTLISSGPEASVASADANSASVPTERRPASSARSTAPPSRRACRPRPTPASPTGRTPSRSAPWTAPALLTPRPRAEAGRWTRWRLR